MVSLCLILGSAFLAGIGTVVFAVPIVPESIVGTAMPEGAVGIQPGSGGMEAGSSEPGLPIRTRQHDDISRGPLAAEGRPGPQPSRSGNAGLHQEVPTSPELQTDVDHMMHTEEFDSHPDKMTAAFQKILKVGSMYELIKMYIEQNGLSGTIPKKLERIRGGFKRHI